MLKKKLRFQKDGFIGEFKEQNIYLITEYAYSDSSMVETQITQFDDMLSGTNRCIESSYETVKYKNGLIERTYLLTSNKRSLSAVYSYEYY